MADDAQEIIGKWTVSVQDWVWEYEFSPDGKVTWRDTRSSEKGVGRWSLSPKFINMSWTNSSTKESWERPITPAKQRGWYSATYYTGKYEMQKVIAAPPAATELTWFDFEPDDPARPGQINVRVSSPRNDAQYIDQIVSAVGFGIYLGGYYVFCDGMDVPVFVPEQMVDFSIGIAAEASVEVFNTIDEARSAAAGSPGQPAIAYFRGAGGAVVAPTVICPASAPQLIATMLEARRELSKAVSDELTVLAISLVGGMIINALVSRIVGARRGGKVPPNEMLGRPKIRARNDQINVGGGLETGSDQFTNLNPVNPQSGGPSKGIPNLVKAPFEQIGEIFQPGTVKNIISNRLRFWDVKDWNAAAKGAFRVLRSGGRIGTAQPGSGLNVWADEDEVAVMIKAFKDAGFKEVKNVGSKSGAGVVVSAIKP